MIPLAVVAWVGTHRRTLIYCSGAGLALVLAGLVARGCAAPTREVTTHEATTDTAGTVAAVAQVEQARAVDVHQETVETRAPDGAVTIRTVRDEKAREETHATATVATVEATHATVKDVHVVERDRPGWRASAAALWKPGKLDAAPTVLHGEVSRRVTGRAWVGAVVQYDRTRGEWATGVVVAVEW